MNAIKRNRRITDQLNAQIDAFRETFGADMPVISLTLEEAGRLSLRLHGLPTNYNGIVIQCKRTSTHLSEAPSVARSSTVNTR